MTILHLVATVTPFALVVGPVVIGRPGKPVRLKYKLPRTVVLKYSRRERRP